MSTLSQHTLKGLIIWVDIPCNLPESPATPDSQVVSPWQNSVALPDIPWDITALPMLPMFCIDPSARIESALPDAEVWLTPQPVLDTNRYTVLKFAGDLQTETGLWLNWDEVFSSHDNRDKRFMLEASTYLANKGIVIILVPNPDDIFLRLWQQYISTIIYDARAVYAIGPGDFNWPEPAQWLADSVKGAEAQLAIISTSQNLEPAEPFIHLEMFEKPQQAIMGGYKSIRHYDYSLEETSPLSDGGPIAEESTLRLDTAVPEKVFLGEVFDLAVSVRQQNSAKLVEQDLTHTESGDVHVTWPVGQDTIHLRIEISAATCEIVGESRFQFRLRYGEDSTVFYFQLVPKRLGALSIIVKVTQEDDCLGSARVRTQVTDEPVGIVETTVSSHNLALTHTDLEIRIGGFSQNLAGYPVEAQLSNGSHYEGGVLVIDENLLPTISHPMEYGDYLWEVLFSDPIHNAYVAAAAVANTATEERLRLRIWIDTQAPSLHAIIWERLLNRELTPPQPMAISAKRPFSRYSGITLSIPEPIQQAPIRMLFVVSNPTDKDDLATLDINAELTHLLDALKDQSRLSMTVLGGDHALSPDVITRLETAGHTIQQGAASLENILRTLTNGEQYHILHILAHGRYNRLSSESDLYLQDNDGLTKTVRDSDITLRLGALPNLPHLVFLAACESARRESGDQNAFVGLASKLVACGVPAVVAMQDMLPIDAAQKLTGDFYNYLMLHGVIDRALAQARLLLFDPDSKTWATPVLYMRLKDGLLFDLEE